MLSDYIYYYYQDSTDMSKILPNCYYLSPTMAIICNILIQNWSNLHIKTTYCLAQPMARPSQAEVEIAINCGCCLSIYHEYEHEHEHKDKDKHKPDMT